MTFLKSKTHSHKLAAFTVSALAGMAAIAAPTAAQAQSYHGGSYAACKSADTDNQVVGGLIGAVVGGDLRDRVGL